MTETPEVGLSFPSFIFPRMLTYEKTRHVYMFLKCLVTGGILIFL